MHSVIQIWPVQRVYFCEFSSYAFKHDVHFGNLVQGYLIPSFN